MNGIIKTVAGIDPSLTNTAVSCGDEMRCFKSPPSGPKVYDRIVRYKKLARGVFDFLNPIKPQLIVIEGYSLASNLSGKHDSVEFGGILRWYLVRIAPIYEVAPVALKKFVRGIGKGDKSQMRLDAFKRWGVEFETDDEVDAYGLMRIGRVLAGLEEAENQAQRDVVKKILDGPAKKKRKKSVA